MLAHWSASSRVPVRLVQHPGDDDGGVAPAGGPPRSGSPAADRGTARSRHHAVGSSSCSTARSASQDAACPRCRRGRPPSARRPARSPVQPSRSSRCGQSVGTSTKLPRMPQTTFSCSRSTSGSEQANVPVGAGRCGSTTASRSSVVELARPAGDLGVAEAVEGEPRLPASRSVAVEHDDVGRRGLAQRRVPSSPSSSTSACRSVISVPAGPPGSRDPQPADQVLPEVDERLAGRRRRDLQRRQTLSPADRGAGGRDQGRDVEGADLDRRPGGVVEPGADQPGSPSAEVVRSRRCRCRPGSPARGSSARSRR